MKHDKKKQWLSIGLLTLGAAALAIFSAATLDAGDVVRIIDLELQGLFTRTGRLGYKIKVTEGAKRRLASMGYEARYGVRSLRRTLAEQVEEPLSTLILDGKLRTGDTVVVESDRSRGIRLRVDRPAA